MRKILKKEIVIMFFFFSMIANAQESSQVGTSMANFLKIGIGSRAAALGGAYVAMANDATAMYWNPGGLGLVNKNELVVQSTEWIAGTKLYFLAFAMPLGDFGTLGAGVSSFSSGEMEETTVEQPDGTGRTFSSSDISINISYARSFTDRFSVGFSIKYINETLSRESADAFAFDIGSVFITDFLNNLRIGIALSNLGSPLKLEGPDLIVSYDLATGLPTNRFVDASIGTQSWNLPLIFRIGLGTYLFKNENTSLSLETAVNDTRDFSARYNVGSELSVKIVGEQKIVLRAGYKGNYDEDGITVGGGLFLNLGGFDFKLDYAYADLNRLGNTQRYTLSILF